MRRIPTIISKASTAEQRVSMEMTAALNEAYATLKQPFRRAEYLLSLHGGPTAAEFKEMEPAFLEEMLELRMEIEELRDEGTADSPARHRHGAAVAAAEKLASEIALCFAEFEACPRTVRNGQGFLLQVRQLLNAAKYIQGLLRDLRAD